MNNYRRGGKRNRAFTQGKPIRIKDKFLIKCVKYCLFLNMSGRDTSADILNSYAINNDSCGDL